MSKSPTRLSGEILHCKHLRQLTTQLQTFAKLFNTQHVDIYSRSDLIDRSDTLIGRGDLRSSRVSRWRQMRFLDR